MSSQLGKRLPFLCSQGGRAGSRQHPETPRSQQGYALTSLPPDYSWSPHTTSKPWAQCVGPPTLQDGTWQSVSITRMPATQL